jgi:LmbE family N-acetylglucosaminyl deacetylase
VLKVVFGRRAESPFRILCIGAHSDDIEIGCGGTLLRLLEEIPDTHVRWVVFGARDERATEARESANRFLAKAQHKEVIVEDFRDSYFPYIGAEIKKFMESTRSGFVPDLVLTHQRNDLHQDHRLVSELTSNAYRHHLILEYEILKYDGDVGTPAFFVPLTDRLAREKIQNIVECFGSQRSKAWFTEDAFQAIMRIRGVECNAPEGYAEAFYCRKITY